MRFKKITTIDSSHSIGRNSLGISVQPGADANHWEEITLQFNSSLFLEERQDVEISEGGYNKTGQEKVQYKNKTILDLPFTAGLGLKDPF